MLNRIVPKFRQNIFKLHKLPKRFLSGNSKAAAEGFSIPCAVGGLALGLVLYNVIPKASHGEDSEYKHHDKQEIAPSHVPEPEHEKDKAVPEPENKEPNKKTRLFSKEDTTVVFVLGGPGAGKGTQCQNLVRDYGFLHLSAGDLLREERKRPGSEYGELINHYIKEGLIVPMEITVSLLEKAMVESGKHRFLIDGFPRKMDQAEAFEEKIVESSFVLYFECPEEVMLKRLMKRGETSGRVDDNEESIKKRFVTFRETSYPVIDHYNKIGKVKTVSCVNTPEKVYENVKNIFDAHFKGKTGSGDI